MLWPPSAQTEVLNVAFTTWILAFGGEKVGHPCSRPRHNPTK